MLTQVATSPATLPRLALPATAAGALRIALHVRYLHGVYSQPPRQTGIDGWLPEQALGQGSGPLFSFLFSLFLFFLFIVSLFFFLLFLLSCPNEICFPWEIRVAFPAARKARFALDRVESLYPALIIITSLVYGVFCV